MAYNTTPLPEFPTCFSFFLETSTVMPGARKVLSIHISKCNKTKHTIQAEEVEKSANAVRTPLLIIVMTRRQIESGLGGGLAYVGLSSKYDRNMSGSCKEISWICFFVTGICNWVQIFLGIKSKSEKKILLSSLQRWISQGSLANAQAQTHTRFQRIVPYQVSNHHN